jgi:hypothetical protein
VEDRKKSWCRLAANQIYGQAKRKPFQKLAEYGITDIRNIPGIQMSVLWVLTPRKIIVLFQRFQGTYYLPFQGEKIWYRCLLT